MGIVDLLVLIKKYFLSILVIFVLINSYSIYRYVQVSVSSSKILNIEIAPINELELSSLRQLEVQILNSKKMIESSYFNRELNIVENDNLNVDYSQQYTPQNLLSLFFDTAVSRENIQNFIKDKNISEKISESGFSFKYNTSSRIDPYTDIPQKTLILSLLIPNENFSNLLNEYTLYIDKLSKNKIKQQIEASFNNLSNLMDSFVDIVEFKKIENLNRETELLNLKLNELNGLIDMLNININENILTLNSTADLEKINLDNIKNSKTNFSSSENDVLDDIDDEEERDKTSQQFDLSISMVEPNFENVVLLQKLLFNVTAFNEKKLEKLSVLEKLKVIENNLKKNFYNADTIKNQNYIDQFRFYKNSLKDEKEKLLSEINIVNKNYTDVSVEKIKYNLWFIAASLFISLFVIIIYLIILFEFNKKSLGNS